MSDIDGRDESMSEVPPAPKRPTDEQVKRLLHFVTDPASYWEERANRAEDQLTAVHTALKRIDSWLCIIPLDTSEQIQFKLGVLAARTEIRNALSGYPE